VHFLRFEFTPPMIAAAKAGAALAAGIDHPHYPVRIDRLAEETRASLVTDFA
jgi:superfamily II helicase